MRKHCIALLFVILLLSSMLYGCADNDNPGDIGSKPEENTEIDNKYESPINKVSDAGEPIEALQDKPFDTIEEESVEVLRDDPVDAITDAPSDLPGADGVVDLTVMSSTMIYAEVYYMLVTPEAYIGRTIKIKGAFEVYDADTENYYGTDHYFSVIIADATACCEQGIEFVLADDTVKYPDDYPEIGAEITVTGEYQLYQEGEATYCHLVNAVIE